MTVRTHLVVDRAAYAPGDSVEARLEVTNEADTAVLLRFATSQRYDFVMLDEEAAEVWRWSEGRAFLQMLGEERIDAGASRVWRERFPAPREAGTYVLEAWVPSQPPIPVARAEVRVQA